MKNFFLTLGRICLSLIFIISVGNKLLHWQATEQLMTQALTERLNSLTLSAHLQKTFEVLVTYSSLALIIATLFEAVGGILVLLGFKVRLGATLLILYLLSTTLIMHAFWLSEGAIQQMQMGMFLKNIGLLGGLLILASSNQGGSE